MKLSSYLKDHLLSISMYLLAILFVGFSLWALKTNNYLITQITFVLLSSGLIIILFEFHRTNKFFKQVNRNLNGLDKKYLVQELINIPDYYAGKMLYDYLVEINKSMLDHVNLYKHSMEGFKEYIELWVHEIKIPLASVRLIIENDSNLQIRAIEAEIKRVENYVEQVLFYARNENVEKDYLIRLSSLDKIIKNVVKDNRKEFIYKKINLKYDPIDIEVYTDMKWLEFILNQIIANSIKYSKEDAYVHIDVKEEKNKVILVIEDNGIGIKKHDINRVFDKGFTGENGRHIYNSTGMGLYLCKSLCEKLHHHIYIESINEQGVKVFIEFPKSSMTDFIRN